MPTIAGCSGRSGHTSNRVMLLRPRRFSTPVRVDVPTLASASRRSDESVIGIPPLGLGETLAPPPHPEERPQAASRMRAVYRAWVGNTTTAATLRDASLRDAPQGEVVVESAQNMR